MAADERRRPVTEPACRRSSRGEGAFWRKKCRFASVRGIERDRCLLQHRRC